METHPRQSVLVVVPVFAIVYARAFKNFLALAFSGASQESAKYRFDIHVPEREILHTAMNNAVEAMLKSDHVAMIVCDDDCLPPIHAIPALLRHYEAGKDVVSGLGYMRGFPHTVTAGTYYAEGPTIVTNETTGVAEFIGFKWLDELPINSGLHHVDFCGFPISMISRRALEKMQSPWFGTELDGGSCTHDVYFGSKAKKSGIDIYVDADLPCGHIAEAPIITPETRVFARRVRSLIEHKRPA